MHLSQGEDFQIFMVTDVGSLSTCHDMFSIKVDLISGRTGQRSGPRGEQVWFSGWQLQVIRPDLYNVEIALKGHSDPKVKVYFQDECTVNR